MSGTAAVIPRRLLLESSIPGVFAVGDVCGGSVKRVDGWRGRDRRERGSQPHRFVNLKLIPHDLSMRLVSTIRTMAFSTLAPVVIAAAVRPAVAQTPTVSELIRAEDGRVRTDSDLAIMRAGLASSDPVTRQMAVRGMGRAERAELLEDIVGLLDDSNELVRQAAANAVAQAVVRGDGVERARRALTARLSTEVNPDVRGQIAESMGRMKADSASVGAIAQAIAAELPLRGAVRGLFFLTRQRSARGAVPPAVAQRLQSVATSLDNAEDVRATAAAARIAAGGASESELRAIRRDPSGYVRVTAATAASITDPAPVVRYRAVALAACPALVIAARDSNEHVALAAIDALGAVLTGTSRARCAGDAAVIAALESSRSPRAVIALAAISPERARERLPALVSDADPFVRVHAARAARRLGDTVSLRTLAVDPDANVASAAIDALSQLVGHADDAIYMSSLRSDASQLLMSAARALGATGGPASAGAPLLAALDRVTELRRETSRDARLALIDAMDSLGAPLPERYVRDFDEVVAVRAAELTGGTAAPQPLPVVPTPTGADIILLPRVTIEMVGGGRIVLDLFPYDAPTNVWRFVRLARAGYYDGLTFHRIVPFFVVQGGSPLANEYVGDGPFTRDEVGLENRRGTVGVSTRGRDTGDGQLYFNTVDNVRLDHDYTVFARVVSGMDVVDRMQEGARIRRVVLSAPRE